MTPETLTITLKIDQLPADHEPLAFAVTTTKDFWFTRFAPFRNWKKVSYRPIQIVSLHVDKSLSSQSK